MELWSSRLFREAGKLAACLIIDGTFIVKSASAGNEEYWNTGRTVSDIIHYLKDKRIGWGMDNSMRRAAAR